MTGNSGKPWYDWLLPVLPLLHIKYKTVSFILIIRQNLRRHY
ncbi:hypothetical protein XNC3_2020003 [Xenorhabdus nematophila F1]|nr:hypothetical protein XNC3_2020003 [Xenorhabdus nematophila F1]